jgi:hypothetical protein
MTSRVGELLVRTGVITEEQYQKAEEALTAAGEMDSSDRSSYNSDS